MKLLYDYLLSKFRQYNRQYINGRALKYTKQKRGNALPVSCSF